MFLSQFFCSGSLLFFGHSFYAEIGFSLPCLHMHFHMVLYLCILRDSPKFIFHKSDQFSAISISLALLHFAMAEIVLNIFFISMKSLFVSIFSYSLIIHLLFCRNYHFKIALVTQIPPLFLRVSFLFFQKYSLQLSLTCFHYLFL